MTTFVGRERELAGLHRLIRSARLVMVTGVSGAGKTRLLVEAARPMAGRIDVRWIALAHLDSAGSLASAVAEACGGVIGRAEDLPGLLGEDEVVLALDKLDHLPGVGAEVAAMLETCPGLRVLGTSRRPLGVAGEHEWLLGPLPLAAAIRLLEERIRARRPSFTITPAERDAAVALCVRVDRLPLAVELVAAHCWVREPRELLSDPAGLLDLEDKSLRAATGHTSLRAALHSSLALLDDHDQATLQQIAVCGDRWSEEAAATATGVTDVREMFGRFVQLGLMVRTGRQFHVLHLVRELYGAKATTSRDAATY